VYIGALLILMCTAWLVLTGTQIVRNVGDSARFGAVLFQILAPLQLAVMAFLAAFTSASAVCQEKDRRTLILLLMTRMNNCELVLGKLCASLLNVAAMLLGAVPVFMLTTLFGGVSHDQIVRVFGVTATAVLAASSLGSVLALWREKTFQTLAMTTLVLVIWIAICEAILAAGRGQVFAGMPIETLVTAASPVRAILDASRPTLATLTAGGWLADGVVLFLMCSTAVAIGLNLLAIAMVRVWNPSREVRPGQQESIQAESIWGAEHDLAEAVDGADAAEAARATHVDARVRTAAANARQVWDNPVLWREICTWAYGRKVLVIRIAYCALFAMVALGLWWTAIHADGDGRSHATTVISPVAQQLAPFLLVSLVIVNALAVTSITSERDGQALDLLLVTDLSPREFVFGKLGGVFWVTKEMIVLPLLLCLFLWWQGVLSSENLCYVTGGLAVMYVFVNMLGIHCGMTYANSRTAIGVSLGAVFFLFLGVITCMLIMISFSGSFQTQLAPFLAFILGGSAGLYVALGHRNPSPAILLASLFLPFATFHAITSFLLEHNLTVFVVSSLTYGFTVAAMMIPAVYEFDIAMGRTKTPGEE
jgi:ABC-type transport system involved in multi-copper enzyme maturation permease subunit